MNRISQTLLESSIGETETFFIKKCAYELLLLDDVLHVYTRNNFRLSIGNLSTAEQKDRKENLGWELSRNNVQLSN